MKHGSVVCIATNEISFFNVYFFLFKYRQLEFTDHMIPKIFENENEILITNHSDPQVRS